MCNLVQVHIVILCSQTSHGIQSYSRAPCMGVQGSASEPKSWLLQFSTKKSTVVDEEAISLLQDVQDTPLACEMDADDASAENVEEKDGAWHCNKLLDELELCKISILWQMAKEWAHLTHLRGKVRRPARTAVCEGGDKTAWHRQSKLKNLRRSLKKRDELHIGTGGQRSWIGVDEARCPTWFHRPDWLTQLRGNSRDLDWNVNNFKAYPRPLLVAIKDKMAAQLNIVVDSETCCQPKTHTL